MAAGLFRSEVSDLVNLHFKGRKDLKLFEAGCGSASHFTFEGVARSVGIDISQEVLDKNTLLDEKILGDLQKHPLPKRQFDIVVCWDVLEHLPRPRAALANMFETVSSEGLLILGFPRLISIKGLVTKFTPYCFHVWFYKRVLKYDFVPFPTFLRMDIIPKKVLKFSKESGFSDLFYKIEQGGVTAKLRKTLWPIKVALVSLDALWRLATLGTCPSLLADNCAIVLKRSDRGNE
jgi:2-polyprenyl-3-methyl-5-hydroxy-6-metoxy-1,4-benzoquinol methylase